MIVDTLKRINLYKTLSPDIFRGLEYISRVDKSVNLGEYILSDKVKAIVSEYQTVENFVRGYEVHDHTIDIQYPVVGLERVKWSPVEGMSINIPYDQYKDRTFYSNPSLQGFSIDIGSGLFAIMFPGDAHSPQHYVEKPELIKKVTVKIKLQ